MTDDRFDAELSDDELGAYLQSRIPAPGGGYWDEIDSRLAAADGDQGHEQSMDISDGAARPMGMNARDRVSVDKAQRDKASVAETSVDKANDSVATASRWMNSRVLLAAAAIVLLGGLGMFALLNGSGDDAVDLATAEQDQDAANQGDTTADGATQGDADPGGAEFERDASPLRALQARLAGQVPGAGEEGAGSAGPYCFTSDDAYIFPADELIDRRALVWLDVSFDGLVNYSGLQGDSIAIAGSGRPTADGGLTTVPIVFGAASGELPPYEITVGDESLSIGEESLGLTPCAPLEGRIETMFQLLRDPSEGSDVPSANWPSADAVLSSAGLGPIRIGMTVSELSTLLGTELTFDTLDLKTAGACGMVAGSSALSNDIWILVELTSPTEAIIRRVSVSDGRWMTPSGMFVGVSEQTVLDTFPDQIQSEPHVYVEGNYLTFQPTNASDPNTVQFVSEGGTIAQIHVGDRSWVGFVEGCA